MSAESTVPTNIYWGDTEMPSLVRLTTIRLECAAEAGSLSEKKKQALHTRFHERYPLQAEGQPGPAFLLADPTTKASIVITPSSVLFSREGDNLGLLPGDLWSDVDAVFGLLMLDSPCPVGLFVTGMLPAALEDSFGLSVERFLHDPAAWRQDWSSLRGVGLRFLFEEAEARGDIRVEPLIRDPQFFHVELSLKPARRLALNEISDTLVSFMDYCQTLLAAVILPRLGLLTK